MVKYYSTQRPVLPGCFPQKSEAERIENFDTKIFCEEIGREAWGYIEYRTALTKEEADSYELTLCGTKTYYCVTASVDDRGTVKAAITNVIQAVCKPDNISTSLKRKDVYKDWFDSRDEAEKFVEEVKTA